VSCDACKRAPEDGKTCWACGGVAPTASSRALERIAKASEIGIAQLRADLATAQQDAKEFQRLAIERSAELATVTAERDDLLKILDWFKAQGEDLNSPGDAKGTT
jgi:hypothetical protein